MDTIPQKKQNATQTSMVLRKSLATHQFLLMWPVTQAQDELWDDTSIWRSHPLFSCQQMVSSSSICWNFIKSILPCPTNVPGATGCNISSKHDGFPPQYLTVGKGFFLRNFCLLFKEFHLIHRTCSLNASGLSRCSLANFRCWILWWGRKRSFLLMTLPWRLPSRRWNFNSATGFRIRPNFLGGLLLSNGHSDLISTNLRQRALLSYFSWSSRPYLDLHW